MLSPKRQSFLAQISAKIQTSQSNALVSYRYTQAAQAARGSSIEQLQITWHAVEAADTGTDSRRGTVGQAERETDGRCRGHAWEKILMQFYFASTRVSRAVFGLVYLGLALARHKKCTAFVWLVFIIFFCCAFLSFVSFRLLLYFLVINSLWPKAENPFLFGTTLSRLRLDLALFTICSLLVNSCLPLVSLSLSVYLNSPLTHTSNDKAHFLRTWKHFSKIAPYLGFRSFQPNAFNAHHFDVSRQAL